MTFPQRPHVALSAMILTVGFFRAIMKHKSDNKEFFK